MTDLYARNSPVVERLPLTLPDNPLVTRIGAYPTFSDAHLGFSIGLKEWVEYEIYELTDPVRIMIAVLYPADVVDTLPPTPTLYLDHWIAFSNPVFAISLEHPVNWQYEPGYGGGETGEVRFAGDNGFFHIGAMDADTGIDTVAANEAGHRLQPYGSQPVNISGVPCRYFVLWADYSHIRTIAQTLRSSTGGG